MVIDVIRQPGGTPEGPCSGSRLRALVEAGRISRQTEVGGERWVTADKVRGLREFA